MPFLREAGLVGAAVILTGGVAYVLWTFVSSGKKKAPQKIKEEIKKENVKESAQQSQVASETKPSGKQVLVLGLKGAGKTSLLHCFATGSLEQNISPTEGFNAVSINKEDLQIEFLEIGGSEKLRAYWKNYLCKALVLVYVVDASDSTQFPLAKKHLHELLAEDPYLSLVVLANKQDLSGGCSITDLHDALCLAEVGDKRKLFLIGTYVRSGETEMSSGVQDARDLIVQMVSDSR